MTTLPSDVDVAATLSVHSGVLATLMRMLIERGALRVEDTNAIFDAVLQPYESLPDISDAVVRRIRLFADGMGREVVRGLAQPPQSPS